MLADAGQKFIIANTLPGTASLPLLSGTKKLSKVDKHSKASVRHACGPGTLDNLVHCAASNESGCATSKATQCPQHVFGSDASIV